MSAPDGNEIPNPEYTKIIVDSLNKAGNAAIESRVPWEKDDGEVFWNAPDILPERWNRLYPYRFLVVDVSSGNPVIVSSSNNNLAANARIVGSENKEKVGPNQVLGSTAPEYSVTYFASPGRWEAVLPITPQQLTIQDQFAINTSATMRGVVEEHNGIKFKNISIAGTTGIWNKRDTVGGNISSPSALKSIFGGTIDAFEGFADSITKVGKAFNGKHPNHPGKNPDPVDYEQGFSTGYYQALYLGQFFERYAQEKKKPANKGWRLVLDMPKRNESYVVTPVTYVSQQSVQKPNEYMFNIQLKAWKRIDLKQEVKFDLTQLPSLDVNFFQRAVRTIAATRALLQSATNLIKAVRSDFQKIFNIIRQISLAIKDLAGLIIAIADLPRQIIKDLTNEIIQAKLIVKSSIDKVRTEVRNSIDGTDDAFKALMIAAHLKSKDKSGSIVSHINSTNRLNEGLSIAAVSAGALGLEAADRQRTDPINNIFDNPEENFDFFNGINLDDLQLRPQQEFAIDDELERVRLLTVNDFRVYRSELTSLYTDIADRFGAGDSTYSYIYGVPEPTPRSVPLTVEENEILYSIMETIQILDALTSTKKYDDFNIENPLEFVGGLADESGIDFNDSSQSKMLVPVPFGSTIEEIAARYLGDPDKYLEIVTLNKLRSPYIDEEGFVYEFLSNGEGRQFTVDDSESNLFVGQKIILKSDLIPSFTRKIIAIEEISSTNFLVTVDGEANLDSLNTTQNARMQGYFPGTVNSQNQIYIPVDGPSEEDDRTFEIPKLDAPNLTKVSKVDFLLTDAGDLAINSMGDFRLANGLTNLIQAIKLKIRTKRGTLLRHLDYGLGLSYGVSVADITSGDLAKSITKMIEGDSRFSGVPRISFKVDGSTLAVDLVVTVANGSGVVPITFESRLS